MSCCNGNCGCSSGCNCGSGCGGCKVYPDMSFGEKTTTETLVLGLAPEITAHGAEASGETAGAAAENGGCKCGDNCQCNPCTCK